MSSFNGAPTITMIHLVPPVARFSNIVQPYFLPQSKNMHVLLILIHVMRFNG